MIHLYQSVNAAIRSARTYPKTELQTADPGRVAHAIRRMHFETVWEFDLNTAAGEKEFSFAV
jgi:hypothetical protein